MKTRRTAFWLATGVSLAIFLAAPIRAGSRPLVPHGTTIVIVPASTDTSAANPFLRDFLESYGYDVEQLDVPADPRGLLLLRPRTIVVVTGGSREAPTARVYTHGVRRPRLLEAEGPRGLAEAVLRHIGDLPVERLGFATTAAAPQAALTPNDMRMRAIRHLQQHEYQAALDLFSKAQSADGSDDDDTLFNMATCLDGLKRGAEAMALLERIHARNPAHEEAAISLANHRLAQKDFASAIAIYTRWERSAKNGPLARYNLGVAWYANGDLPRARQYFASVPADDSRYERAARFLVEIDRRLAARPPTTGAKADTPDSPLKYWAPVSVLAPIVLVWLFRRRVKPSVTIELGSSDDGRTVRVRNTSAGDVALFDLVIRIYPPGDEGEIESVASDLAANSERIVRLPPAQDDLRVALSGVYYLFPRVRMGAFQFRRDVPLS